MFLQILAGVPPYTEYAALISNKEYFEKSAVTENASWYAPGLGFVHKRVLPSILLKGWNVSAPRLAAVL